MSNAIFKIIPGLLALLLVAACGNKQELNIPERPPPDAFTKELTPGGLVRMAARMEAAGDWNSAANFYADALAQDRNLVEAHIGLGRSLSRMGQDGLAAAAYGNALDLDEDNYEALKGYLRGLLPNNGQTLALAALNRYLRDNPPTPELLNYKGIAHDLESDFDAAELAYRQGLAMTQPGDRWHGTILGNLALSLGLEGNTSEAILLLNPFIGDMRLPRENLSPYQSGLRQNLALVYALAGNPESAVEVAKSALSEKQAEYNRPFYMAISALTGIERVKAVLLGELPRIEPQ